MKSGLIKLIIISLLTVIASCQKEETGEKRLTITVIPKGTTHVYWKSIHAGAVKGAKEMDVDIVWVGTEKEDDRQQQIALVDNQVINAVDGIVLAPLDDMALRRPVRAAVGKGIPVVIIDSDLQDSEDIYTSFIATDNMKGGRIAGEGLGRMLNGNGNVVLLREQEGAASTEKRAAGFLEAINEFPGINVLSHEQYGGATREEGLRASENMLLRFTDASGELVLDGIFCVNESTTYGMLQALKRKRLAGKVIFVGFDSSPSLIEGLQKGEINGLVVQDPFKMGYLGVRTMANHLRGNPIDKYVDTGVYYVTLKNIDEPGIRELLYPDLKTWIGQ